MELFFRGFLVPESLSEIFRAEYSQNVLKRLEKFMMSVILQLLLFYSIIIDNKTVKLSKRFFFLFNFSEEMIR